MHLDTSLYFLVSDLFLFGLGLADQNSLVAVLQGVKLELFIFDTFPLAQQVSLMEVLRDSEFAPVKNAPGSASDSPDTARQAILSLHQRWV